MRPDSDLHYFTARGLARRGWSRVVRDEEILGGRAFG